MNHRGILTDTDNDLAVIPRRNSAGKITGGLVIADTILQNTAIVLGMNQGELKEDPLLGPGLLRLIRSKADRVKIERAIKVHLERAGIDYRQVKNSIILKLK
jgi:cobalamin biosynthesis protein CbiG